MMFLKMARNTATNATTRLFPCPYMSRRGSFWFAISHYVLDRYSPGPASSVLHNSLVSQTHRALGSIFSSHLHPHPQGLTRATRKRPIRLLDIVLSIIARKADEGRTPVAKLAGLLSLSPHRRSRTILVRGVPHSSPPSPAANVAFLSPAMYDPVLSVLSPTLMKRHGATRSN